MQEAGLDVQAIKIDLLSLFSLPNEPPSETSDETNLLQLDDTLEMGDVPPITLPTPGVERPLSVSVEYDRARKGKQNALVTAITTFLMLAVALLLFPLLAETETLKRLIAGQRSEPLQTTEPIEQVLSTPAKPQYTIVALEKWRTSAEIGNPRAQYLLGQMYRHGVGVDIDSVEAARWYQPAAEQGYAQAQYQLGLLYFEGEGLELNYHEAARWFALAASQGHPEAQFNMAVMELDGLGVAQDYDQAVIWLRRAAAQGVTEASGFLEALGLSEEADLPPSERPQGLSTPRSDIGLFAIDRGGSPGEIEGILHTATDINTRNAEGMTPLMIAAGSDSPNLLMELINRGADINAQSVAGWTALMYAAKSSTNREVLEILLLGGADLELSNENGETAVDIARRHNPEMLAVLERAPGNATRNVTN